MLTVAKSYLKLLWIFLKFNLSAAMEYRVSFIVQVVGMMLNNASFIFFWWIIFEKIPNIAGYTMKDVMFLWALSSSTFGLAFVLFGNINRVTNIIVNGELDTYLLQPRDVYFTMLSTHSKTSAWGDFFYGIILFVIIYGFSPEKLILFGLFTILGSLVFGTTLVIFHSLTFYIGNASGIANAVFEFMITFTLYPEGIYKGAVKWIIYTILPAGFIVFLPYNIMQAFNWGSFGILVIFDILYIILGYLIFNRGLKNYESGNLITTKM